MKNLWWEKDRDSGMLLETNQPPQARAKTGLLILNESRT